LKPSVLHFEWQSFLNGWDVNQPITTPGLVWLYVDHVHSTKNSHPTLVFRVWYHSPRGMIAYIGDQVTGPQNTWSLAMAKLIRTGHWATANGVLLQWHGAWMDDWDEVQP
jgi:hypothetical protein